MTTKEELVNFIEENAGYVTIQDIFSVFPEDNHELLLMIMTLDLRGELTSTKDENSGFVYFSINGCE